MMKIVVSSAKRTVVSGGRTEGRSMMNAEKRVGPKIERCGTPEGAWKTKQGVRIGNPSSVRATKEL